MRIESLITNLTGGELLDSLLPDFVLSFAFFTALIYAAVGKRFDHQRSATMLAVAIGLAFSISLVWWEYQHDFSMKDLGPIAVGFAVILLGGVMYRAIRQVGGTFAGAGIALGASLIVGWILGLDWYIDPRIVQTVTTVALIIGILAFLTHRGRGLGYVGRASPDYTAIRHDTRDLYDDRRVARQLRNRFRHLRREADHLHERPADADDIMLQLRRMLPAEGWLTERLATLRARAHVMRKGHIARIEEIQGQIKGLPPHVKRLAAKAMAARYKELNFDL